MYYKSCVLNFKNSSRMQKFITDSSKSLMHQASLHSHPARITLACCRLPCFCCPSLKPLGFILKSQQFPLVLNMTSLSGKPNATATATQNNPCRAKLEASRATLMQTFNFTRSILIYFIRDILPASIPATLFQACKLITRSEKDETTGS